MSVMRGVVFASRFFWVFVFWVWTRPYEVGLMGWSGCFEVSVAAGLGVWGCVCVLMEERR